MADSERIHFTVAQWTRRYGLALLLVLAAAGIRRWPLGAMGSTLTWVTFYPAVMAASLYGGLPAGLLATGLSCLSVTLLWPLFAPAPFLKGPPDLLGMAVFALTGVMLAIVAETMLRAKASAAKSARALAENLAFTRTVANAMPGMIGYWDRNLRCRFANHAYVEWFGKQPEDVVGLTMLDLVGPRIFALNEPHAKAALRGEKQQFERVLTKADGSIGHSLANYIPDLRSDGTIHGFFVLATDVTALKETEAKLTMADTVYQNTVEGIVLTDADQVIISVNPAFTEITGYTPEEALGRTPRILKSNHHEPAFYEAMWHDIETTGRWQGEIWNRRKGGEAYLEWLTITRIRKSEKDPVQYVSVFNDITELRSNDERIRHLAFHDALTDLPNRALLMNRLDHQIAKAARERGQLAVLFLDLDRFKDVNDSLGHDAGDELLKEVAHKLQSQVRHVDTVARLGGDEFVILLDSPIHREEVEHIAGRVLAVIHEPMDLRDQTVQVGTSIGIALFPEHGVTPEELIKKADKAMYGAKEAGRNTYRFS